MEIDHLLLEAIAGQIGQRRFEMWFGDRTRFAFRDQHLLVGAPSEFLRDFLKKSFRHIIAEACERLYGKSWPMEFVVGDLSDVVSAAAESAPAESVRKAAVQDDAGSAASVPVALLTLPESEEPKAVEETKEAGSAKLFENAVASAEIRNGLRRAEGERNIESGVSPQDRRNVENGAFQRLDLTSRSIRLVESEQPAEAAGGPEPVVEVIDGYNVVSPAAYRRNNRTQPGVGRRFASLGDFLPGVSNDLPKKMAEISVLQPGVFNPLFFYGSTSVGKTHLAEGIYSAYRADGKRKPPLFLTADRFTSLFTAQFARNGEAERGFRRRFADISLLVIDDLHFFRKEMKSTQAELIGLIDLLKRQGVQMVFTADRPLGELTELRSELLSRLEGGIVCEIKPADRETLLGVFQKMAADRGLTVPPEVARLVVSRFAAHARQLSGALNRLHLAFLATGRPITVETAEEALADLSRQTRRMVRLEEIERVVAEMFGIEPNALRSKSRAREYSCPRMLAMWLARKHTRSALSEIGRYFNRNHSTVISAQRRVDEWLSSGEETPFGGSRRSIVETVETIERVLVGTN